MSIEYSSSVEHPIETVFAWHERPGALQRLAPPWQAGRVRVPESGHRRSLGQASPRASSTRCFQTIANPRTATQPARTSQWPSARV
jgi:ligand-binding SRPBCC domain-containing protein